MKKLLFFILAATLLLGTLSMSGCVPDTGINNIYETDEEGNYVTDEDGNRKVIRQPNENPSTDGYDAEITFFGALPAAFGWLFFHLYTFTGENYILTILIVAIMLKIVLFPLAMKQQKNNVKQAKFRPIELAIIKKYKGRTDQAARMAMQNEMMEQKRKAGVSMFGGCLPLVVQMPIVLALFSIINNPLRFIARFTGEQILAIENVMIAGGYTGSMNRQMNLVNWVRGNWNTVVEGYGTVGERLYSYGISYDCLPNFYVLGMDITYSPWSRLLSPLILVPLVSFGISFLMSRVMRKYTYRPPMPEGQGPNMMKAMEMSMPLMTTFFAFTFPAAIGIYWIFQHMTQVSSQFINAKLFPLPTFTEEELKAAEREYLGKSGGKKKKSASKPDIEGTVDGEPKPRGRSLHFIDEDEE